MMPDRFFKRWFLKMKISDKAEEWIDRGSYRKKILADQETLGKGKLIQIVEIKPGETVKPHKHGNTEETFHIQEPAGKIEINGETIDTEKNQIIICEPGDVHKVINNTEETLRILVMKKNYEENDTEWLEDG